jgi:hypothetical protein
MEFLTNEKVLVAIIAAFSAITGGVLTSVISPWIKIKLEAGTKEKERKSETQWGQIFILEY